LHERLLFPPPGSIKYFAASEKSLLRACSEILTLLQWAPSGHAAAQRNIRFRRSFNVGFRWFSMKGSYLPSFVPSDGLKKYLPEYGNEPALWCAGDKFQSTEQGLNGPLARSPQSRYLSNSLVRPTSLAVAVNLSPSPKLATNFPCLAGEPFLARQIGV